jgi:hypothetical protein
MSDPVEEFASLLNLDASTVFNAPALIFLCGGPTKTKGSADPSLRALFYKRLKQDRPDLFKHVRLAEEATAWSKTAKHYGDLLKLEHDLASLSAVVLVIVESAGSIAELGLFCQADVLSDKLVAVIEDSHQNEESFIQNGPVALHQQHDQPSVLYYPWLAQLKRGRRHLDRERAGETVVHLVNWLSDYMRKLHKEEKFRPDDTGHRLLLIADLISLGTIIRHSEIVSLLRGLQLRPANPELDRYLFLLEKLSLISKTQYSNTPYYLAGTEAVTYVTYAFKPEDRVADRHRLKSDLQDVLPDDPDRHTAFKAFQRKSGK